MPFLVKMAANPFGPLQKIFFKASLKPLFRPHFLMLAYQALRKPPLIPL